MTEKEVTNQTVGRRPPEKTGLAGQLPSRWVIKRKFNE
jgi:hypothetical protein